MELDKHGSHYEVAKIEANALIAKTKYSETLDKLLSYQPDYTNLQEANALLKASTKVLKDLKDGKLQSCLPEMTVLAQKEAAWDEPIKAFEEGRNRLKEMMSIEDEKAIEEIYQMKLHNDKKEAVKKEFFAFVGLKIKELAAAQTAADVVTIQKRFGSEKSRTAFYGDEFVDDYKNLIKCIKPYLEEQKAILNEKEKLKSKEGNNQVTSSLLVACDYKLVKNLEAMQASAFDFIQKMNDVSIETTVTTASGRYYYYQQVVDQARAIKKHPDLVCIDEKKLKVYAEQIKDKVEVAEKKVLIIDGIKYFFKKTVC